MRASLAAAAIVAALAALASPGATSATSAEPGRSLTLAEADALALAHDPGIAIVREATRIAAAQVDRADGSYDTVLQADTRFHDRTDPVNSVLSGAPAGELAPERRTLSGSAGVSHLFGTGGTVALSTSVSRDETNNFFSLLTPAWTTSIGVELRQPLLENRRVDPARTALRVARIEQGRSDAELRASVNDILAAVERDYWNLAAARRDLAVRESSLALAEEQRSDTRVRIETGMLPESDLAQTTAEVERRRGEIWSARQAVARAENALKARIVSGPDDPLWNETIEPVDSPESTVVPVDLASALARARELRPELAAAQSTIERAQAEGEAANDHARPALDLVAAYALRGLAGEQNPGALPVFGVPVVAPDELVGGLGRSYGTLGDFNYPDAVIGVTLRIPIGNHTAKADAAIAAARHAQSVLALEARSRAIEVEVRDAVAAIQTATGRIEAARAGRAASVEQLRVEMDRLDVGLSTNFLVLTRQNELARAELSETAALVDYRKALSELARATGALLEERDVSIVEASDDAS